MVIFWGSGALNILFPVNRIFSFPNNIDLRIASGVVLAEISLTRAHITQELALFAPVRRRAVAVEPEKESK